MGERTALVWLRNDLRLADNPALHAAFDAADRVAALYVHQSDPDVRAPGGAARWWLHHSLADLNEELAKLGVRLSVHTGSALDTVRAALKDSGATSVFWNRRYGPAEARTDLVVENMLRAEGVDIGTFAANVLAEPWTVKTGAGNPFSVYTPFWKALKGQHIPTPLPAPKGRSPIKPIPVDTDYRQPRWAGKLTPYWHIGEAGAHEALAVFIDGGLPDYPQGRDFPARAVTSRLSPHLRFGEISPRQIWHAGHGLAAREPHRAETVDKFLSELAWRDFNYHQLYHREDIATVPMQGKYATMTWRDAPGELAAWQQGRTGFPIVDAGMREMWATGFMQNRVRMLTASLLAKNLLIDWRRGEQWFWDCLVDADDANNPGNWQWVAGSGLDASPYFRIFNPVTQGERFDVEGAYVRQWVPELAKLPDQWVQQPFAAPADVLRQAGIVLGQTYPQPIVDLKTSRVRALEVAREL